MIIEGDQCINGISVVATIERGENKEFLVTSWKYAKSNALDADGSTPGLYVRNDFDDAKIRQEIDKIKSSLENSSKVVDENGEPMVVYHGGKGEITVFEKNRIGENLDYGTMGSGFYFTSDRENAENYARNAQGEGEPTVVEAFLNIRNAKDVNWNELDGESRKKSEAFTDKAIAKGHDGFTAIAPNKAQVLSN